jgi:hypothetical protein
MDGRELTLWISAYVGWLNLGDSRAEPLRQFLVQHEVAQRLASLPENPWVTQANWLLSRYF